MATQTVEQVARLAPFQEDYLKDIFEQAKALGDTPQPFAEQQLAGLSGGQQAAIQAAMSGIGGYQPYMQRAQQYATPGGVSEFFNPYEDQVVQQTLSDIGEQGQIAQNQLAGQGVASGAFGDGATLTGGGMSTPVFLHATGTDGKLLQFDPQLSADIEASGGANTLSTYVACSRH